MAIEPEAERPTPAHVVERLLALDFIYSRSGDEERAQDDATKAESDRRGLLEFAEFLQVDLEPDERAFMEAPVGAPDNEQTAINAYWRYEGAGVLAWALGHGERPVYDRPADGPAVARTVAALCEALMHFRNDAGADPRPAASIRPADEIHRLSVHLTIVRWRLVQYLGMGTRQMAFEEYLRSHPMFSERWLDDIAFVDGDLAIDGCAIGEADEDLVVHFNSRAMERQIAAYWLEGDGDGVYADVTPSTLLSACGEPETYARLQQEAEGEEQAAEQRLADQRRGAEETLAAAAAGGEAADGAGLVAALEAIEPKLLRFQKVFLEDFRRQVNAGGDTPQLRAKALEILQARQA